MKKINLILAFLCLCGNMMAQVRNYGFTQTQETYQEITDGTVIANATGAAYGNSFDDLILNLPAGTIPFNFQFNDVTYTGCNVSTNGFITFGATAPTASLYSPISGTAAYQGAISAWGGDINGAYTETTTSNISWKVVGSSPNREFVIQYKNIRPYRDTSINNVYGFNFQIRLLESSNQIKIVYGPGNYFVGSTSIAESPEIGLRGASNTDFNNRFNETSVPFSSSTLGTVNNSDQKFNTTTATPGMPSSGLTYTYSPPVPCAGAPQVVTLNQSIIYTCSGATPTAITGTNPNMGTIGITYQWQSSTDQVNWTDVTVGNFTNATNFTPPTFNGTTTYYRLKTTCTSSNQSVYSASVQIVAPQMPNAVTSVTTTDITGYSAKVNWVIGNGGRRLVLINTSNNFTIPSTNGAAFTANTVFANNGQQIVFDGTTTAVTITNLNCNTTYYVRVLEYIRCGSAGSYVYYFSEPENISFTTTGLMSENTVLSLPQNLNLTGYTGTNLSAVSAGWEERTGTDIPNSASTSEWLSSNVLGVPTIKVNLYTTSRKEWIVSPLMQITAPSRINLKAAMTDYNSSSADPTGMGETRDDKVEVLISTDSQECSNWVVLHTWNASNANTLSNLLQDFEFLIPSEYIGQNVRIAIKATDGPYDDVPDYDFHITNLSVSLVPSCGDVTNVTATNVTETGTLLTWNASNPTPQMGYEIQVRYMGTQTVTNTYLTTSSNFTITDLIPGTKYDIYVRAKCNTSVFGSWSSVTTITTLCDSPDVTSVTPDSICGIGTATLAATASNGDLYWYNANNELLHSGTTFTTPQINQTTSYFVTAADVANGAKVQAGQSTTTSATFSNPLYSNWSNIHTQHLIKASELVSYGLRPGPITSVALDVTNKGALPLIDLSIKIGSVVTTNLTAFNTTAQLETIYTSSSFMPVDGINTFNFTTPFIWDGTSDIILEFCHGNPNSTATISRTIKMVTTSYASSIKSHVNAATSAATICGNTTSNVESYLTRPLFIFEGTGLCFNPNKIEVVATVTQAPDLSLSSTSQTICAGSSSSVITITNGADSYDEFTITPNTGVTGNAVDGWVFSPTTSTVYTLLATQTTSGTCAQSLEFNVTVTPLPNPQNNMLNQYVLCPENIQKLELITLKDVIIGTATTLTGSTDANTAFNNRFATNKQQYIYTAQEIYQAGGSQGVINSISFNINSLGDNANNANYTIKIKPVTYQTFTSTTFETTGFTTVCNYANYTHTASGWQTIVFTTPYVWDGTSNLIIELTHSGSDILYNATTYYTAKTASCLVNGSSSTSATGTINDKRLNIKLAMDLGTITWSPTTNLYTNAAGTVPYQANSNASTVYVRGNAAGTTTYQALVTSNTGCNATYSTTVTVQDAQAPQGATSQSFIQGATVADLEATGTNIVWYATLQNAQNATNPLATTVELVNGQTYYAVSSSGNCRSEALEVTVQVNLGSENFEIKNLRYYPNPVQSNLEIVNTHTITKVEVYTLLGQRVMLQNNNANQVSLNLEKLSAGTYLLKVFTNNASKDIKVIKK